MGFLVTSLVLIAIIDFPPLLRSGRRQETLTFLLFFLGAMTLAILRILKVEVPSILEMVGEMLKAIGLTY